MSELLRTRLLRFAFNFYPCYRRTGARVTYIAHDYTEVRIKLPLNWKTRGYWGTFSAAACMPRSIPCCW